MRVLWNSHEPPVPLDLAWDSEDEPTLEFYAVDGALCTVQKTQHTGLPDRSDIGRVYVWLDGAKPSSAPAVPTEISNHIIYAHVFNEDPEKRIPLKITQCLIEGKTAKLTVSL